MAQDKSASFKVSLEAEGLKGAAVSASAELKNLFNGIKADTSAIKELETAQRNLAKASVVDMQAVKAVTEALAKKKEAVAAAQGSILGLAGGTDEAARAAVAYKKHLAEQAAATRKAKKDAEDAAGGHKSLRDQIVGVAQEAQKVQGPVGGLIGRFRGVTEILTSSHAKTILMVGGLGALAAGAGFAAQSIYELATATAEAARNDLIALQGFASIGKGWKDATAQGEALQNAIAVVSSNTALGGDAVEGLAKQLFTAKLRGDDLQTALAAASTVALVQGQEAANKFVALAGSVRGTKGAVDQLAKNIDIKLGGIASAAFLSSAASAQRLKDNVADMFSALDVEPLLQAKSDLADLFSDSTESGQKMRQIIQPLADSLIKLATGWIEGLQTGILQGLIWFTEFQTKVLELEIAWLDLKNGFNDVFPKSFKQAFKEFPILTGTAIGGLTALGAALVSQLVVAAPAAFASLTASLTAGGVGFAGYATAAWGAATAGWAAIAPVLVAAAPFLAIGAAIGAVSVAVYELVENWDELGEAFSYVWEEFKDFGSNIVSGLVDGIAGAWKSAVDKIKGLAGAISGAFKSALGIHSPSKVFAGLGSQIPAGVEAGIEKGRRSLDDTINGMVTMPKLGSVGSQGASNGNGGVQSSGGQTNYFEFNFAAGTSEEQAKQWEDTVTRVLGNLARQNGAI